MARAALIGILALVAAVPAATASRQAASADCSRTSVGLVPLTDLGPAKYRGHAGGLYPGGRNAPSARYLARGLAAAKQVRPVGGKIVLLSIGMSNATQEFSAFKRVADAYPRRNPRLVVVDGAQGGQHALEIGDPSAPYWSMVDRRLRAAGATRSQVQAVWLKQAYPRPTEAFPADARKLRAALRRIHRLLDARFPNLRLVYVSSRIYGGYASTALNPEPWAYQSGFAVKWLVQDRIENKLGGPWVGWGPYLWADGTKPRKDGLTWACEDLQDDGTHPSPAGARKVAERLLRFFATDRTAKGWFLRSK